MTDAVTLNAEVKTRSPKMILVFFEEEDQKSHFDIVMENIACERQRMQRARQRMEGQKREREKTRKSKEKESDLILPEPNMMLFPDCATHLNTFIREAVADAELPPESDYVNVYPSLLPKRDRVPTKEKQPLKIHDHFNLPNVPPEKGPIPHRLFDNGDEEYDGYYECGDGDTAEFDRLDSLMLGTSDGRIDDISHITTRERLDMLEEKRRLEQLNAEKKSATELQVRTRSKAKAEKKAPEIKKKEDLKARNRKRVAEKSPTPIPIKRARTTRNSMAAASNAILSSIPLLQKVEALSSNEDDSSKEDEIPTLLDMNDEEVPSLAVNHRAILDKSGLISRDPSPLPECTLSTESAVLDVRAAMVSEMNLSHYPLSLGDVEEFHHELMDSLCRLQTTFLQNSAFKKNQAAFKPYSIKSPRDKSVESCPTVVGLGQGAVGCHLRARVDSTSEASDGVSPSYSSGYSSDDPQVNQRDVGEEEVNPASESTHS